LGRTLSTRNEVGINFLFFKNFFTCRKTIKFYCVLQPAVMLSMLWGCLCTSDILGPNYYFKKPHNSSNPRHQKGYFQLLLSYLELSYVSSFWKLSWWEYLQFIYSITNYKKLAVILICRSIRILIKELLSQSRLLILGERRHFHWRCCSLRRLAGRRTYTHTFINVWVINVEII